MGPDSRKHERVHSNFAISTPCLWTGAVKTSKGTAIVGVGSHIHTGRALEGLKLTLDWMRSIHFEPAKHGKISPDCIVMVWWHYRARKHVADSTLKKTSYRKISQSLEGAILVFRVFQPLLNLTWSLSGITAEATARCKAIQQFWYPIARVWGFAWSYDKSSRRLMKRGPRFVNRLRQ